MKLFQGGQAEAIEAKVDALEVALRLRHKGPIEDRLQAVLIATTQLVMLLERRGRELTAWYRIRNLKLQLEEATDLFKDLIN